MFPGNTKFMREAFTDATAKPFSYMLMDLKPVHLHSKIFPGELQTVYIKKWSLRQLFIFTIDTDCRTACCLPWRNILAICKYSKSSPALKKELLKKCSECNRDCALNILKGNVPISSHKKSKLAWYKKDLWKLAQQQSFSEMCSSGRWLPGCHFSINCKWCFGQYN